MSTPKPQVQEVTSTQNTAPWGPQQEPLKFGIGEARNIYDQGPQKFFPGQTFAGPSSATLDSLNSVEARARAGSPVLAGAENEATKVLGGHYLGQDNPYMQGMIDRTAADILPRLGGQFANSGGPGGLQTRAATMGLADSANSLRFQNYGAERQNMANTMNNAGNIAGSMYGDAAMLGQVGAAREGIEQQGINEDIARFDYGQMAPNQALAQYMQMISGNYGGQSTGTTQQLIPQQNPWTTALGGLLGGAGAVGALQPWNWKASDERLKENIKPVGETYDGTPLFSYRYKFGGPPEIGVMAQDLLETKPEAVAMMPSGYLAVNYGML